jgi:endonuclease/exonuclease/phosphatase family metal-dependent hydrolase
LDDLLAVLPGYGHISAGRDDGKAKGEASPIFYKTSRFEVLKSGHFWLSEQPDRPSKGWDAALNRICTWGQFKDKESGKAFWFFNLHMDHVGVVARAESAKLVLAKIKEICGAEPVILTGDFNVDQRNESYTLIAESGLLRCAYETAVVRYAHSGTFNAFNTQVTSDSRIDHIFVSKDFTVERYGILTDTYVPQEGPPRLPSDHYPVKVVLSNK